MAAIFGVKVGTVLFLVLCAPGIITGLFDEFGVVKPDDPFVFVGENITLFCNITNVTLREDSSQLYFERSQGKDTTMRIPQRNILILTTKSIKLYLPRIRIIDEGTYVCKLRRFSNKTIRIGQQIVRVDYRPQAIESISCLVHNWDSMKCNWSLGQSYHHPQFLNVTLGWVTVKTQKHCPNLTLTSCYWSPDDFLPGFTYVMIIKVAILVEGKLLAKAMSPVFSVPSRLYVEPAPVKDFQVTADQSTCVRLKWETQSFRAKHLWAQMRSEWNRQWQNISSMYQAVPSADPEVCDLLPHTRYDFRVAVLPFPRDSMQYGKPSVWESTSVTTLEDVPASSPASCQGCFYEFVCHGTNKEDQCRNVRLFWQMLPETERNGVIKGYKLIIKRSNASQVEAHQFVHSRETYADIELPSDEDLQVKIQAGTSKGYSQPFVMNLPSDESRPSPPSNFLVERDMNSGELYLSWAAEKKNAVVYSNITIVWCRGDVLNFLCNKDIRWHSLEPHHVTYKINYTEGDGTLLVGIIATINRNGEEFGSGIKWSSCTYIKDLKPQHKPMDVHFSKAHPELGLTVLWKLPGCLNDRQVYITEYNVIYCHTVNHVMCHEAEHHMNVSGSKSSATITNLDADITYLVYVVAVSPAGFGPRSAPIVTTVTKNVPEKEKGPYMALIIISIILFLLVVCIICCCKRYITSRKKKFLTREELIHSDAGTILPVQKCYHFQGRPLPAPPEMEPKYERPWV